MLGLTLLFAALAATASATGYKDGHEYVYTYRGQIFSGYPRMKPQYSGYSFSADVVVQPQPGDYALFAVTNVKNAQFNGEFENVQRHPHNYVDLPAHAEVLTKPFKVYRKNGIVSHFEVMKGEPAFSVNLKRGLVSLFNLNFGDIEAAPSTESNEFQKPDPDRHYYKVYEKGMLGDCETAYVIGHHPSHKTPDDIVLNVTKVRNYHKCHSNPNLVYGVFHGHQCGYSEHDRPHTLHGSAQYHYDLRGYRHSYIIEKIKTVGEMALTPFPMEGQTVSTTINRYFELKSEGPVSNALEFGADVDSYNSLEYEFGFQKDFKDPVDLKSPHYYYHLTGRKVPVDVIKTQMEELVQVYDDESYESKIRDKEFPAKFVELLKSVGSVGYDEINELYNVYGDIPKSGATVEQKRYRGLFVDTLVNLGTNPAIMYAKHLIENKKARPQEASYFFTQLPKHIKEASQVLFDDLQALCEHESVKKHDAVHISCVMALSTMVHDFCVARYHPEIPASTNTKGCQPEDAIKYFDYVAKHFEETEDEKLKTAYLKAGGNIGLREILPHIKPYIEGAGNPARYLRKNAIWAILNVGFRFPEKVRDLLVPLLYNQTENYELRLSAFSVLMIYRPALYEFEGVARALKYDRDDQVRSYIYSTFKSLVNSTHPCDRKVAKDAEFALRILEDVRDDFEKYDYSYSKHFHTGGYNGDYDFGGSSTFAWLSSDTGFIPRSLYVGLEDYIGGKSYHTVGFGFQQYGLEKIYDKFFGPEGSFGHRSLFDLFKKKSKRDTHMAQEELSKIKEKVDLPVLEYDKITGEVYFMFMGSHVSFFHFNEETFADFFKDGRFTIPNLPALYQKVPEFSYQRFMLTVDRFYAIPTESGIPLMFDYKQPIYYYHHNKESSFKVEPGFFPEDRAGKWPDHVKAETDGYIAVDKNLFASMGVLIPFDQVIFGSSLNQRSTVSFPLKMKFDLDVKEKQLNYQWTPVAPHEIFHFKYATHTFVDSYANSVPMQLEAGYMPMERKNQKHHDESYLHDTFGVGFDVHAKYESEFNDFGSWLDFFCKNDWREKFYYMTSNPHFEPYVMNVQFSHAKQAATKEMEGYIKYRFHDNELSQPQFSELGFEDYKIATTPDKFHFCSCELEAEVTGKGDKERKVHTSVSWTRDLIRSIFKINFLYDRTPFTSSETQNFKICGSSYLKYPKYDIKKIAMLDTIGMDHAIKSEAKVHFGKDCSTDQKIKVKGVFSTTEEQREMEAKREEADTPEHYNPYAHYYQKCLKERQGGENYGKFCMRYLKTISTVHDHKLHAHYENLSPGFLNHTYKLKDLFHHMLYSYSDHNEIGVSNPSNEYNWHANFSMHLPVGDITTSIPTANSHYNHVYAPTYQGLRSYPEFEDVHVKNSFSDIYCKLEGDHVLTFDSYEYQLPPYDCFKVIAKDCSPHEHFTVLGTKITHPHFHKSVKVLIGKHVVEAFPPSDDAKIVIKVDGKRVKVTPKEPYIHHEEGQHSHAASFYLTNREFYYTLHSEKYGLIVEYDGRFIVVQVAPYYRSKTCGLCGNYNGQKYDGMTDARGCYFEDETAYSYAYAIPSNKCTVPKFEAKCRN